ncbi:MAG: class I SAM-dependent methyltransferase [Myxococcota bacterium]
MTHDSSRSEAVPRVDPIPTRVHAEAAPMAQYDPTYFQRHGARNRDRVERIVTNMTPGARVLDIGCNRGYFSRAVLDLGIAPEVVGVEPSREQVDAELLADPRFSLHEGDITDFDFGSGFHAIIYCAVHHHVFGHRGYVAAFELWQRLVAGCDRHIFFETGQLAEGSRWYWQRALRREFPQDEEHIGALLQAVGPRLEGVRVLGEHPIHGTRRWLLRIDLRPRDVADTTREDEDTDRSIPLRPLRSYRRTVGSQGQALLPVENGDVPSAPDGAHVHQATAYTLCERSDTNERVWCKKSLSDPFKDRREYRIGRQVRDPLFVRPLALDPELGIVFPYVEGTKLSDVDLANVPNREAVLERLLDLYEEAADTTVVPGDLDLDPRARGTARRLIDVIDLHPANVLASRGPDGELQLVGVLDLEYFRNDNEARNAKHLARLLLRARSRSPRSRAHLRRAVRLGLEHRQRWRGASVEDRLYEKHTPPPRKWTLWLREAADHALRPLPGHWQ